MWEIVFGPIPEGLCVLHKCDNPPCFNWGHLRVGTDDENRGDRIAKRRSARAETNGSAKLTWELVAAIRADPRTHRGIAAAYGISKSNVGSIKLGQTWKVTP